MKKGSGLLWSIADQDEADCELPCFCFIADASAKAGRGAVGIWKSWRRSAIDTQLRVDSRIEKLKG